MPPSARTPLIAYWAGAENYRDWSTPAQRVVQHIRPSERWVCDLGCGAPQAVRALLPADKVYLPADVKRWTPDTALCNLEGGIMPGRYFAASDVCLMLGVVEYLEDPASVFRALAPRLDRLLVTYSAIDAKPGRNPLWVNHFTEVQFAAMIQDAGFAITARHFIEDHLQIFLELTSRKAPIWRALAAGVARAGLERQSRGRKCAEVYLS